ncbi:MAG: CPBP family intramembrane metalloprotease [Labilithrix sp.]|nr:CPBP family intramembrane metalloprotease [Labilithrix sp.]
MRFARDKTLEVRARRGLLVFALLTIGGTSAIDVHLHERPSWMLVRMWTPGIASLLTRLLLREGLRDISLRFDVRQSMLLGLAWVYPIVVITTAYGLGWTTGLEPIQPGTTAGDVASSLVRSATWWFALGLVSAAGEELGWRGYMLPRLVDARIPNPIGVSGLLWWAWHLPLVLTGQLVAGPHPLLVALMLLPSIMAFGVIAALLRFASGSVWPAVVLHASFNAVMDVTFDPLTAPRPGGSIWTGAAGLLVGLVSSIGALLVWRLARGRWRYRLER